MKIKTILTVNKLIILCNKYTKQNKLYTVFTYELN